MHDINIQLNIKLYFLVIDSDSISHILNSSIKNINSNSEYF